MFRNILIVMFSFSILSISANAQAWEHANGGKTLPDSNSIKVLYANGDTILAGTAKGVFISTSNGSNWMLKNSGLEGKIAYSFVANGGTILAGTTSGVYTSTDLGSSWIHKSSGMKGETVNAFLIFNNIIIAGTTSGFYSTGNNGNSWVSANRGIPDPEFTCVNSLAYKGNLILAGTSAGLFLSADNGSNWVIKNNGIEDLSVWAIAVKNNTVYISGDGYSTGVYSSDNNCDTWVQKNNGLDPSVDLHYFLITVGDSVWAGGTYSMGVLMTSNNGDKWVTQNDGLTDWMIKTELIFSKNDKYIFVGSKGDNGYCAVWRKPLQYSGPMPDISGANTVCFNTEHVYSVNSDPNYKYKWVVTGGTIIGGDSYSTVNVKWTGTNTGSIAVTVTDNVSGLFGNTSIAITINELPVPVLSGKNCCTGGYTEQYFAETHQGSSYNWTVVNGVVSGANNLDSVYIQWNKKSSGTITLTETNSKGCPVPVSLAVELLPNAVNDLNTDNNSLVLSPNPATNELNISYILNTNKSVSIIIFDILGNEVYTESLGQRYAGQNSERLNLKDMPAGMYYLKLNAGSFATIKAFSVYK